MFTLYVLHFVPAFLIGAPVWYFSRNRIRWFVWETSVFIVPFLIWSASFFLSLSLGRKGWGNLAIEPILLAVIVPLYFKIRTLVRRPDEEQKSALLLLLSCCCVALMMGIAIPKIGPNC